MSRIIFVGMLVAVLMSAGAAALAFEITKLEAAHQRSAPADPSILTTHRQNLQGNIALP
jgi:flagellar basal body-associated protein FliL